MPTPSELQHLRQRLESLSGVCLPNAALETRKLLVAAAFGAGSCDLLFLSQLFDVCVAACQDLKVAACEDLKEEAAQTCIMGAAAALLYLPGRGLKIFQQFLDCVFMPMLTSSRLPSQAYPQIASSLCSLLASESGWDQLSSLLHMCGEGLQKASSVGSAASDTGGKKAGDMLCMPLHTCCCLAPSILEACCQPSSKPTPIALESTPARTETQALASKEVAGIQDLDPSAQELLSAAIKMLLPQALDSIGCPIAPLRKANFHHILPALLSASRALGVQTLRATMTAIWDACLSLLPVLGIPRQAALAVMVQLTPLLQEQGGACMERVWHDALFWERLRACLAGEDALDRKRGAFLLQHLMPPTSARMPAWRIWLLLHDALEGFAPHLIFAAMAEMNKLHPACPDSQHNHGAQPSETSHRGRATPIRRISKASTDESKADVEGQQQNVVERDEQASAPGADAEGEQQIVVERDEQASAPGTESQHVIDAGVQQAPEAMEQLSSFGAADELEGLTDVPCRTAMAWLYVLWQRAMRHRNLQVQRTGLRQFLQRQWQSDAPRQVPNVQGASSAVEDPGASMRRHFRHNDVPFSFAAELLIPALCKDIHYKGRAVEEWDAQAAARTWLAEWLRHQTAHAQRDFVRHFLATLKTAGSEGFVQGLRILTGCMVSAHDLHKGLDNSDAAAFSQDALTSLQVLLLRLRSFSFLQLYGQKHDADLRLDMHHCLLRIAHCAAPVGVHVRVHDAVRFISEIPSQDTVPGGQLNTAACAYMLALSTHHSSSQPTKQLAQQPSKSKTTAHCQPSVQTQPLPIISWDAAAVQAAQSAFADLHTGMAQCQVPSGAPFFDAGLVKALQRHARLFSLAALICGSCPEAAHVTPLLTTAAQDLWPLYQRAYVHPIELMKRIILLKEILVAVVSQGECWHGAQPLLHTLVEVCTISTEALCTLGKSAMGALLLPAKASHGSADVPAGKHAGSGGGGVSDDLAAEQEQQQLQSQTVVEALGAALVLLARMRPSLPAQRCAKLHPFLDALASTLLPLMASVQAIRPSTHQGAHLDLKTSTPSPSVSDIQIPQGPTVNSISSTSTNSAILLDGSAQQQQQQLSSYSNNSNSSAQQQASAAAHHQRLLSAVHSACHALCEAAGDASVGAAVAAGLQPHAELTALLLQLSGGAAESRGHASKVWGCLDALMSLASKARSHHISLPVISFGDEPLTGKPPAGHSTFKLGQDVMPQLILAALEELERGNSEDILAVLRCLRCAWIQCLEGFGDTRQEGGETAAHLSQPGVERPSMLDLAWRVVRAVCPAMKACKAKYPALPAAFISTLLPPQLIPSLTKHTRASPSSKGQPQEIEPRLAGSDTQSPRAACKDLGDLGELSVLHDAKGPVPWAINCILDWGFSSPRVMLLLSCHLASLIIRRPQLLKIYVPQLQQILMQSADDLDNGFLMRRTLSSPCTEIERELRTVLPPSDQVWIFESLKSPRLAARAAVLCALHNLAEHAALVWHPSEGSSPQGHPKSLQNSSTAAHHAKYSGKSAEPTSPRKRPIIIFEKGGEWEDVRQLPGSKSDTNGSCSAKSATADAGISACDPHVGSSSCNGGLQEGGSSSRGLPPMQASHSNQGGSSAPSSSSRSLSQGLSMLGRLTGEGGALPSMKGTTAYPNSGGGDTGGLEYGKHSMESAFASKASSNREHQSVWEGGWVLWRAMLHAASTRTDISTDKVKRDSDTHRLKVRVWQALVVLTSFVQRPHIEASLRGVIALMSSNDPPSVKQYQEATAAALLVKEPSLFETAVLPTLENYQKPHPGIGSLVLVAVQVCLHVPERDGLLPKLLRATVPWLSSHAHNVRSYAQLVVYALLRTFPPESLIWSHTGGDCVYIQGLFQFLDKNLEFQRLCWNVGLPSIDWDPEGLASPHRLFCGETALIQQAAETLSFEGAPATLLDRLDAFLREEYIRLRKEKDRRVEEIEQLERQVSRRGVASVDHSSYDRPHGMDFQRKVTTQEQIAAVAGSSQGFWGSGFGPEGTGGLYEGLFESGLGDLLELSEDSPSTTGGDGDGAEVEGQVDGPQGAPTGSGQQRVGMGAEAHARGCGGSKMRQELIVVASLLDKAENLAGLSRTCEVFRAGLLVVPDLRVVSDPLFQTISVTAEKWIPMAEVRAEALLDWLMDRKAEGFTCVGLEQTVESCNLPSYSFPARCVLVLGKEKEGLPPAVIQVLDDSVEIPQLGLIRSLNVHVSGAIAMYEYTRQRTCPKHN